VLRLLTCLIAALFAVPLRAELRGTIIAAENGRTDVRRVPVHTPVQYYVHITTDTPGADGVLELDPPGNVTFLNEFSESIACGPVTDRPIRCTLQDVGFNSDTVVQLFTTLDTPGTQTFTARVDGIPSTYSIEVVDQPSVVVVSFTTNIPAKRLEPGQLVQYGTTVSNGGATASNVTITWTLPDGGTFEQLTGMEGCTLEATRVTCTRPTLAATDVLNLRLDVRAPERVSGGEVVLHTAVTFDGTDFDQENNSFAFRSPLVRHLTVTNTDDAGSGSLRQALLDSQTLCADAPCTIDFAIAEPLPPNGWYTIRPLSQLPEVRGWVKIDGQLRAGRPEVELLGIGAGDAHGLVLGRGCEIQVLGLALNGFARSALEVLRGPYDASCGDALAIFPNTLIARNLITSSHRGVMVVGSGYVSIVDNTIKHNVRSGIYANDTLYMAILRNIVAANGASGMFLDVGSRGSFPGGADVYENSIVDNGEWGIARTDRGEYGIQRNAIALNRYQAIDLNLDFETPNRPDDDVNGVPNKPVLFSAQYDPATGKTIVRGHLDSQARPRAVTEIDVYASRFLSDAGQASAEAWVGVHQFPGGTVESDFTIEVDGDLRGLYLTAATTRRHTVGFAKPPDVASDSHLSAIPSDTSELSNVVVVQ
jgi:uncharacterized repeat protein (TIGR01451 family)